MLCILIGTQIGSSISGVSALDSELNQQLVKVEDSKSTYSTVMLNNEATFIENKHIDVERVDEDVIKNDIIVAEQKSVSDDVISDIKNDIDTGVSVIKENKREEERKKYRRWLKREINKHRTAKGTVYNIPSSWNSAFKAYMGYQAVTDSTSPQFKMLRSPKAYTDDQGLRMVEGRYCVALGSGFTTKIGTKVDIELTNGVVIPCILGDQKQDVHTKDNHMRCVSNGSVAEFIMDDNVFYANNDSSGTVNFAHNGWGAKIKRITVLN